MDKEQIKAIAEKADDYADDYLQSKGEFHPNWHDVRDEYFANAVIESYKAELLKEVQGGQPDLGEPVAYMTTDEEGSASMLFFDRSEALKYSGDDEPVNLFAESQLQAAQKELNQCSGLLDDSLRSIEMLEDQLATAEQQAKELSDSVAQKVAEACALLEEATSYTSCETWSPSLTDEINKFLKEGKREVMTEDKIKEAFAKEVWSDTVWRGCGPTALDIYQAGYMACLNSLEYAAIQQYKDSVMKEVGEPVAARRKVAMWQGGDDYKYEWAVVKEHTPGTEPLYTSDQVAAAIASYKAELLKEVGEPVYVEGTCELQNWKWIRLAVDQAKEYEQWGWKIRRLYTSDQLAASQLREALAQSLAY